MKAIVYCVVLFLAYAAAVFCGGYPSLVVEKAFDDKAVVFEHPFRVRIDIYNKGTGDAYDVLLLDSSFAIENYTLVDVGTSEKRIPVLKAGQEESLDFTLVPLVAGPSSDRPALISYTESPDSESLKRAFSTTKRGLYVMTLEEYHIYVSSNPLRWALVFSMSTLLVVIPFYKYQRSVKKTKKSVSSKSN